MRGLTIAIIGVLWAGTAMADDAVKLHAAGSLRAALGEIADGFEASSGITVARTFGPSGLLRQRLEDGEPGEVYASAAMRHPQALSAAGSAAPTVLFARNSLCAIVQENVDVDTASLLDVLLDPSVRVGTSTPKADPAGDYAFALFDKAGELRDGAADTLKEKALQLTGGPDSASPPEGRNPYGWVMEEDRADVFLTYCTNAVLAQREVASLRIVPLPPDLSVGADYGLTVLNGAGADAWRLAFHILSPEGQAVLAGYGFTAPGLPAAEQ